MSALSRSLRRIAGLIGATLALAAATATPASAALTVDFGLRDDAHDIQALYVDAIDGQYRLTVASADGNATVETADIAVTPTTTQAQAEIVQSAINLALDSIGPANDAVTVTPGEFEGASGLHPYLITFDGGPFATKRQPLIKVKNGTTPPSVGLLLGIPRIYVETRFPGGLYRGDERVDYTVSIDNTSTSPTEAAVGDSLACQGTDPPKNWTPNGFEPTQYDYEWRRNGVTIPGESKQAYTVTAADEGAALQCIVKGTNANGASAFASLPAQLVEPPSSPLPPAPASVTQTPSRPSIEVSGADRICKDPTLAWTGGGTPVTFAYQWMRNGEEIVGATTNTYTPDTAGVDKDKVLQCMIIGKTGTGSAPDGGGLAVISPIHIVGTVPNPPTMGTTLITTPNAVLNGLAELTAEVELPSPGSSIVAVSGSGWSCVEVPASGGNLPKAECANASIVSPGSGTSLTVGIALSSDIPDEGVVEARASAPGVGLLEESSSFEIGPQRPFGVIPGRFSARALDALGEDFTQAGGHPAMATTSVSFERERTKFVNGQAVKNRPVEQVRNASAEVPPGFIGNPQAIPDVCPSVADLFANACPPNSLVGELAIQAIGLGSLITGMNFKPMPLYAIEPEDGVPAQFATIEPTNRGVYVLTPKLRPDRGYAIGVEAVGITTTLPLEDVRVTLCGYGANSVFISGVTLFRSCKRDGDPGALDKPFLTSQTECAAANPKTIFSMDSWLDPGDVKSATALAPKMTGCELVPFEPKLDLQPESKSAESPTGLDVDLSVPTDGLEDPDGLSQAHLKKTTVTLPEGMSVNPSAADGLAACTQAQLGMSNGVPNDQPVNCPNASKIGTAEVKTPILEETLTGSVYLAKQGDNPFGTLAALYLVVESKERGILIKLAGRVDFKANGQVVSTFDDNPQAPISSLELDFHSGPRATLMTPQKCGSYDIVSELTPWSAADPDNPTAAETVTQKSAFTVDSGPGGGPCPTGALEPSMNAGLSTPLAGFSSPFTLRLSREDGSQRFDGLDVALPPGLAANLRGVPYCPDSTLASIPTGEGTGQAELDNPSCPAASQVGQVTVGAGAGNPFYTGGNAYLAGPYKGAPLSLAVVVPAVAGPFDLGNVVVRNAIEVDPKSAQVTVKSDPIPTHVHNVPVDVRDIRVAIDREGFTQAPTSCEEMAVAATVSGEQGGSANLASRFQVGECGQLAFKPRTSVRLFGGIARGAYQGVRAVVRPRPGDANISRTVVRFPRSAFVAQEHLKDICTRVQYAADACPKRSVYGRAIAYSPLLDEPLRGNVYLRSSDNALPDLVADLRGPAHQPIRIEVAVRNDSVKGALRNTVQAVPDAPVSYFRLQTFGKNKGLIVNSRNICKGKNQARVAMAAHNGRRSVQNVNVFNKRCKAYKRKLRKAKRKAKRGAHRSRLRAKAGWGR